MGSTPSTKYSSTPAWRDSRRDFTHESYSTRITMHTLTRLELATICGDVLDAARGGADSSLLAPHAHGRGPAPS